jgi:hypothetical protein
MVERNEDAASSGVVSISGVVPRLAVKAHHTPRSETGIGALMPWADRLWFVTYVAHKSSSGGGTGLFWVDDNLVLHKHEQSVVGTYANRLVHSESNQLFIGPHVIDPDGNVKTIDSLKDFRLTATCRHLTDPGNKVYFLGMEGEFLEVDVHTFAVKQLFDLCEVLDVRGYPHFKDAYTRHGRVIVANNSYFAQDFDGDQSGGRLAEWDGENWEVLERTQFNTISSANGISDVVYAVGQDRASAILRVFLPEVGWRRYRLPKSTHTQDHAFTTEWPRIREVESERLLMDASGMFYELPSMAYDNAVWGVRPIASHLRIVADFCSWNGMLVLEGDQNTPIHDSNPVAGQRQANLWLGKTDDLWSWGKPQGWGGPWWESSVRSGEHSDPYLMTGFEHKCLHLSQSGGGEVEVDIEVDFMGNGKWRTWKTFTLAQSGYECVTFPTGFSAHWVRLTPSNDAVLTAQFIYS